MARRLGLEVEPYSGRGMYGRECASIAVGASRDSDDPGPEDVIAAVGIAGAWMDAMGLGTVVYWPDVQAPTDPGLQAGAADGVYEENLGGKA